MLLMKSEKVFLKHYNYKLKGSSHAELVSASLRPWNKFRVTIPYINIHTHHLSKDNGVFLFNNRFGFDKEFYLEKYFSVGIHPWDANLQTSLSEFEKLIQHSNCLAIGECGLDKVIEIDHNNAISLTTYMLL